MWNSIMTLTLTILAGLVAILVIVAFVVGGLL
jgi:hypothetical protein